MSIVPQHTHAPKAKLNDISMYQGRTAAEGGLVFGHENMGVVTEVGSGVTLLEKGDRIVLPFSKYRTQTLN